MLQKSTLLFLKAIKKNNNREWFEKNRIKYESAKEDIEKLADELIKGFSKHNKKIALLRAKDCTFRIFRDVRFSKNKSPYKTNMGAYIAEGGKKTNLAGIYIHIEPGSSFIAGGMWMPDAERLKAIRQEIDYNAKSFKKILNDKTFKKLFTKLSDAKLKTTPKGYAKEHPEIELLKYTSYIVEHPIKDEILTSKSFIKKVAEVYKGMMPFFNFLNTAVEEKV